jgi:hypothetical protein
MLGGVKMETKYRSTQTGEVFTKGEKVARYEQEARRSERLEEYKDMREQAIACFDFYEKKGEFVKVEENDSN